MCLQLHTCLVWHDMTSPWSQGENPSHGELKGWSGSPAFGAPAEAASPLRANVSRADLWLPPTSLRVSGPFPPPVRNRQYGLRRQNPNFGSTRWEVASHMSSLISPAPISSHTMLPWSIAENWGSRTDFASDSDGKESACKAGDPGLIPGLGRSPRERNGYPLQYSCLENSMDRGVWRATFGPWGCKESDTTEQSTLSFFQEIGHFPDIVPDP